MSTWFYTRYILYTNLCSYLFMHFCERKKIFIKIPTLIFTPKVIIIGFWQIWHFDLTGWMGLELSVILMQTAGRFDM